ncbi:3-isopropylmalate dehydratase small subunit 1 [Usitatibacter rugosus]|uniref:3-isopropylmalate dehydratase n=1 Tax=Usitatibacter rugosus TaxID=2732067 RepID=A0A6M4GV41_9PROT|nr:3-isopropylmalate dehydratase small subunit [Usitatibacter rugosus]QJR10865.1 3-isopropylmalate dehydratase small subunit 1 [Usitatibacter rugosus]
MKREPIGIVESPALPVPRPNVDTDQILPARYLQKPRGAPFGDFLFRDVRDAIPLDDPVYRGARIVVGSANFGCGSSREHAVWALYDHGFRVAIAPSFGDIFRSNAIKNGLLPVLLPEAAVASMLQRLEAGPGTRVRVDLARQRVTAPDGTEHAFEIDAFSKRCLLEGLDELAYTLTLLPDIERFERTKATPA